MSVAIQRQKLLIVEGKDEQNFFEAALASHLGIADIQVMGMGGKTKLRAFLRTLVGDVAFPNVTCLGIVRDADVTQPQGAVSAADSAFQSVCSSMAAAQLSVPVAHAAFHTGPPRVGVFIMPNGTDDGMLETLCMEAVTAGPEYHCVTEYFACLANHQVAANLDKARAHAWLASRPAPDLRVGEAALKGYWPFGDSAFTSLWDFVSAM